MTHFGRSSRRHFLKTATATTMLASSAAAVLAAVQGEKLSANDRIRLATIGSGGQGTGDTQTALRIPGVELVAVADVYDGRLIRAKEVFGNHLFTTRDHREIISRKDVDAVLIATPDHWHAQIAVDALNAGKDVYIEKPMVQTIDDGQRVIEAARKNKRIVEVGSQRVSNVLNHKARELYQQGAIGDLNLVEAWINRNSAIGAWQYSLPPDASPQNIDWERFLGEAPKRPFDPVRLFRWRNYKDYGTGVGGDLFVHLLSGIHLILSTNGPTRVMATGGIRFWKDGRDAPDVMLGLYDYPKTSTHPAFNLSLKVNLADNSGDSSFRFVGSEGVLTLGNTLTLSRKPRPKAPGYTIATFPKAVQESFLKDYFAKYPENDQPEGIGVDQTYATSKGYSDSYDHLANFFAAMRTRRPVIEDAVYGLRAAGPALLTNLCYFEKSIYGWNPETMRISGRVSLDS